MDDAGSAASRLATEKVYPAPPDEVWAALTDSPALAAWFMRDDFAPRPGSVMPLPCGAASIVTPAE